MTHHKILSLMTSPLLGFLLLGCGGASINSIEDLKNAYVDAGFECEEDGESDIEADLIENGIVARYECGDATLTLMDSRESLIEFLWASRSKLIGLTVGIGGDYTDLGLNWAVGDRWFISDDDVADATSAAEKMGAEFYSIEDGNGWVPITDEIKASAGDSYFEVLKTMCGSSDNSYEGIRVSNDGGSIEVDTKGEEESDGASYYDSFCFLAALEAPDYVYDLVKTTRALDGTREERWGDIRANWTYHPDDGLNLILISDSE